MSSIHKIIISTALKVWGRNDVNLYEQFMKEANLPLDILQERQLIQFKNLFNFSKKNIPYYHNLFEKLKLQATDFKTIEDLQKIPILTKKIILNNPDQFIPQKPYGRYVIGSTGGSTGEPLKYRMSMECNSRGWALEWRSYSYTGFNIGDKLIVFGGGSLVKNEVSYKAILRNKILNYIKLSSFGMNNKDLYDYFCIINKSKAKFMYGYPSSMALLANYMIENNLKFHHDFVAVFSTAEMLTLNFRTKIEEAFKCKVYDDYGMSDGGISAHEDLSGHMLIDTERAILEVVNDSGLSLINKQGNIIATSLYNYDFPFIRYDVGDMGAVTDKFCNINSPRLVLEQLGGRTTDYIKINGKTIGSPVLTVLMSGIDANRYQFIQTQEDTLEIRIEKGKNYTAEQEMFIRKSIMSNIEGSFNIIFDYSCNFYNSDNKHKFIINELPN
jgi:phenylacetate-CoA ligase